MIKVNSREEFLIVVSGMLPMQCSAVEIGVLYGDFSKKILEFIEPGKLFLIDPYKTNEVKYEGMGNMTTAYSTELDYENLLARFAAEILSEQIVVKKEYSYEAVNSFPNGSIDFIYLDGSHLFEDTKRDLNEWLPKLKDEGLMCLHDYINLGNFGVIKAVDDFVKEYNFGIIIYNGNGGDIALKKL